MDEYSISYGPTNTGFAIREKLAGAELSWSRIAHVLRCKTASYLVKIELKVDEFLAGYDLIQTKFMTGYKLVRAQMSP